MYVMPSWVSSMSWPNKLASLMGSKKNLLEGSEEVATEKKVDPAIAIEQYGATEAHAAAFEGDCALLTKLISENTSLLYLRTKEGETPAHHAAAAGEEASIQILADFDISFLHEQDLDGWNPAHTASFYNNLGCLKAIAGRAPSVLLAQDKRGQIPADLAEEADCVAFLQGLTVSAEVTDAKASEQGEDKAEESTEVAVDATAEEERPVEEVAPEEASGATEVDQAAGDEEAGDAPGEAPQGGVASGILAAAARALSSVAGALSRSNSRTSLVSADKPAMSRSGSQKSLVSQRSNEEPESREVEDVADSGEGQMTDTGAAQISRQPSSKSASSRKTDAVAAEATPAVKTPVMSRQGSARSVTSKRSAAPASDEAEVVQAATPVMSRQGSARSVISQKSEVPAADATAEETTASAVKTPVMSRQGSARSVTSKRSAAPASDEAEVVQAATPVMSRQGSARSVISQKSEVPVADATAEETTASAVKTPVMSRQGSARSVTSKRSAAPASDEAEVVQAATPVMSRQGSARSVISQKSALAAAEAEAVPVATPVMSRQGSSRSVTSRKSAAVSSDEAESIPAATPVLSKQGSAKSLSSYKSAGLSNEEIGGPSTTEGKPAEKADASVDCDAGNNGGTVVAQEVGMEDAMPDTVPTSNEEQVTDGDDEPTVEIAEQVLEGESAQAVVSAEEQSESQTQDETDTTAEPALQSGFATPPATGDENDADCASAAPTPLKADSKTPFKTKAAGIGSSPIATLSPSKLSQVVANSSSSAVTIAVRCCSVPGELVKRSVCAAGSGVVKGCKTLVQPSFLKVLIIVMLMAAVPFYCWYDGVQMETVITVGLIVAKWFHMLLSLAFVKSIQSSVWKGCIGGKRSLTLVE